ncbi:MAG: sulfite exporter TauE/SafE family protein [Myxococcales bacterium]|nr:sulfite exporter TauE/SafE family protein [Myxococcales bacterium]
MLLVSVFLAIFVGIALGLLGGGGSILTLPILRYVLDIEAHQAVAMSLLVVGTTSLAALIPHARSGRIRWRIAFFFGVAGMAGAFLAGRVAKFVPSGPLLALFALVMLTTAVAMLRGPNRVRAVTVASRPVAKILAEGFAVGVVTGLVGAGGGFLVVPALVLLGGLAMDEAVGTSLVVISMKSFAGLAGFLGHTTIDWTVAAWVTAAAVVGSVVGGALVGRVRPSLLRESFGWLVVAMALFIATREVPRMLGSELSALAALALALLGSSMALLVTKILQRGGARQRERSSTV